MPSNKKVWVPKWLENNQQARLGLGVLVQPGREPASAQEWRSLWEERVRKAWDQAEEPRSVPLIQEQEEVQPNLVVNRVEQLLELVASHSEALFLFLDALEGDQKAKAKLLEMYPQEDAPASPEAALAELREANLDDLVGNVAETEKGRMNRLGA